MIILLVEDERKIARALKKGLEQEKYAVDLATDGDEGFNYALYNEYDLIILDVMLPGMDGFEICKKLRDKNINTPILMLTAKDQEKDIIKGLNKGADDYLPKPFSFDILLARIKALLRRPQEVIDQVLKVGDLSLNLNSYNVSRSGVEIELSSKEYSLLEFLMRNKGIVLSKNSIINHVWDFDAEILPNTVEVFINFLRSKVDKPFEGPNLIKTVRGFGYKLSDEE